MWRLSKNTILAQPPLIVENLNFVTLTYGAYNLSRNSHDLHLAGGCNRNANSINATALLATAGLRYRTGHISFVTEYRYVRTFNMPVESGGNTGDVIGNMDLSGQRNFIGLGIHF